MTQPSIFSESGLQQFLENDPVSYVKDRRSEEHYDLISFGGGSCPKVVGRHAPEYGWSKICFLTNGSDNGGSTYKIVEALRETYGPTLPVGDITSALIGLLDRYNYELLNLRSWQLDPARFSKDEIAEFGQAISACDTFLSRLKIAIDYYSRKLVELHPKRAGSERNEFYQQLTFLAALVDEIGLIQPEVDGLRLQEASIRHHLFNAVMIRVGAYNNTTKSPDPDYFRVGLYLLQKAFQTTYSVFPCSVDEQVLYAEWVDQHGAIVWSTRNALADMPVLDVGGQVAISNVPDGVKRLANGEWARYGVFGFDPDLPKPRSYPGAVEAIQRLRSGAPIIFGPSSYVASIAPCLAVPEITDEISRRTDCPRILFLNLTLNNETVGWSATDFLDFWELNTERKVADTLDYIVLNNDVDSCEEIREGLEDKGDSLETFKFRGPLAATAAERNSLPARGIHLVEAPLAAVSRQLVRLSSEGDRQFVYVPSHNSARLMEVCNSLVVHFKGAGEKGTCTKLLKDGVQFQLYAP